MKRWINLIEYEYIGNDLGCVCSEQKHDTINENVILSQDVLSRCIHDLFENYNECLVVKREHFHLPSKQHSDITFIWPTETF